jgi:hypothetical protein
MKSLRKQRGTKTAELPKDLWKKLIDMKTQEDFKTIGEVIEYLFNHREKKQ